MRVKCQKSPKIIIWNRVKSLREKYNLRQAEVAQGAGIAISTLWFIEQGFDKKTTIETKRKLADYFKCDIEDIFPAEMIGNEPRKD